MNRITEKDGKTLLELEDGAIVTVRDGADPQKLLERFTKREPFNNYGGGIGIGSFATGKPRKSYRSDY